MEATTGAFCSEFIGSFFLVLTIGFNVLQNTTLAPVSIGMILMAMIFATGGVSGGHYNPAVTLGVLLREGGKKPAVAGLYMAVQLVGGVTAGITYWAILGSSFTLGPGVGYTFGAVFIVELLFTAALVFVVLNVATADQDKPNQYFGLAIGFTVMAAAFAIGPISGCSLNPAVTLGVMVSHLLHTGRIHFGLLFLYTAASFLGAALAAGFFRVIREQEYEVTKNSNKKGLSLPA